jgi:hypothetical protein
MIRGNPRFDGVALGEGSFSFLGSNAVLEGKGAFVNTRTGDTHGWTKNTQWSPQTIEKLKELRALMEVDLGNLHLESGGEVLVTAARTDSGTGPGGLDDHLGVPPA